MKHRSTLEIGMQGCFALNHRGSADQTAARVTFNKNMRGRLDKRSYITDLLIPEFSPLFKRLTPGPGYLEALVAVDVDIHLGEDLVHQRSWNHNDRRYSLTSGCNNHCDRLRCIVSRPLPSLWRWYKSTATKKDMRGDVCRCCCRPVSEFLPFAGS
ncbi:uncharacterized protein A1O9_08748 [Exophiala aquamarina CBS 119918]|uniref:Uncharacterized protein n=1 Tax=Exophiala aquamarina CBS 119918 TaxID=1182545 RepID=A0A072PHS7_9EURO|nr:uncharacterized protein A1O9_08748 [Exophiala aquamarina CBS 119918]KEF55095.1 hypothetical protein A1O9_08748 [Exophiala aquamarina CBS 119918]